MGFKGKKNLLDTWNKEKTDACQRVLGYYAFLVSQ